MKILLTYVLAVFTVLSAFGQNNVDSTKVYFRINQRQFDLSLGDNRAAMERFVDKVLNAGTDNIDSIVVCAYASPDGINNANELLAKERCNAIVSYIADNTGISRGIIRTIPGGIAWDELRNMVAKSSEVPSRQAILDILDNTPIWVFNANGKIIDGRKKRLMSLAAGVPYRWMVNNIFPELRNAVAVACYIKTTKDTTHETTAPNTITQKTQPDTKESQYQPDTTAIATTDDINTLPRHRFALKNNFLYDAALMPNLELEWLINDHWSVAIEGDVAWWKRDSRHKYYQIAIISSEVRRWIRPRNPWHGMYVGLFAGGGWYDFENGGLGYYGEGGMAGLSCGYMWPIGKHFSFDAGIGAGYMYTRYKEYEPHDGHYLYQRTKYLNYFGPLKLKFSIAWRFNDINKPKKTNSVL